MAKAVNEMLNLSVPCWVHDYRTHRFPPSQLRGPGLCHGESTAAHADPSEGTR